MMHGTYNVTLTHCNMMHGTHVTLTAHNTVETYQLLNNSVLTVFAVHELG